MDRQPPTVHVVGFLAQEVEQLGVAHGDQEVKAIVRVAHNEEQGRPPVAQGIQLQLIVEVISRSSAISNTASRAPQEIKIDLAVLPETSVKDFLIKFTKKPQKKVPGSRF